MALDAGVLKDLCCSEDKGPLLYFEAEDTLYNPRLHRRYPIRDDKPLMDEYEPVDEDEHKRLTKLAADEGIALNFEA